jgi:hypothetical protein
MGHVGPHVQLREDAQPWDGGKPARGDILHPERHDPEPGLAAEGVQHETRREVDLERRRVHRPVGEQQVGPAHAHDPRTACHHGPLSARPEGRMMPPDRPGCRATIWSEGRPMEMAVGIALIVVAALLIVFIVRTVQANMPRG